ncbi:MAG: hypothetical protein HY064_16045 [Bacteroidetes bacterium]|nr:hypothetical protein [Bacteroidota bacterium]
MKPFLQISIGISIVLLSGSFLIRSIVPANAAPPKPADFIDESTNKIGKYMMSIGEDNGTDYHYFVGLVWDTETGKSATYYLQSSGEWSKGDGMPDAPLTK